MPYAPLTCCDKPRLPTQDLSHRFQRHVEVPYPGSNVCALRKWVSSSVAVARVRPHADHSHRIALVLRGDRRLESGGGADESSDSSESSESAGDFERAG